MPNRTISNMTGDEISEEFPEVISARISAHDVARLDRMATRRGVEREQLIRMAIDELLAQEAWSGGFIPPPPAAGVPRPTDDLGRVRRPSRFGRRPRTH